VLVPGSGGVYDLEANGEVVYSKHALGRTGYPDADEVLAALRDAIGPEVLTD
jgi:predicted Rdx family selenoprotein